MRLIPFAALRAILGIVLVCLAAPAVAQLPEQVLHDFSGHDRAPGLDSGLIQATDGYFYGTTRAGGAFNGGSIFRMTAAGDITTLHSFSSSRSGTAFQTPNRLLEASDGNLYGTTAFGGNMAACPFGCGTIFRMTPGGTVATLHVFQGSDGRHPAGALVQATNGMFYGTTEGASSADAGTVFRMDSFGVVVTLHNFPGGAGGFRPVAIVQASDGLFYGVTSRGGAGAACPHSCAEGTAYRMTADGTVTTLHSFMGSPAFDGSHPNALVQGSDGQFYGTTEYGGVNRYPSPVVICPICGAGTVFKMTTAGVVTTIHAFTVVDGARPAAPLVQASDGWFYGTTTAGGAEGLGTVFRVGTAGALSTFHAFGPRPDGYYPRAPLVQARDGLLYGTTSYGGGFDFGTIFTVSPGGAVSILRRFPGGVEGKGPESLVEGRDGNVYGTTRLGGAYNHGTIFRMTREGATSVAYTFAAGYDGGYPSALVPGSDGALYGTTSHRGAYDRGIAFRFALDGSFTILHAFTGTPDDGAYPASLIQGADGALYGTATEGGLFNRGTVFRLTSEGAITVLHHFAGGPGDGAAPSSLVQASDGNFYGTTSRGGMAVANPMWSEGGTIFRVTPSGAYTLLHFFDIVSGVPTSPLVQGPDGHLYGATVCGRVAIWPGEGSLFRLTLAGTLTVLSGFSTYCDEDAPLPVVKIYGGRDGALYAAESSPHHGSDYGGVFALGLDGTRTRLSDQLASALLSVGDGYLYVTRRSGGAYSAGQVVRLHLQVRPFAVTAVVSRAPGLVAGVRLQWSPSWGATSYTIYRAAGGGPGVVLASGVAAIGYVDTAVIRGVTYRYLVSAVNAFGEQIATYEVSMTAGRAIAGDVDGDARSDVGVFRPSTGTWYLREAATGSGVSVLWGAPGDVPVAGDYDGDGIVDLAVFRPATGTWYLRPTATGVGMTVVWGGVGDVPAPGDYDGDGTTDIAVFRPSSGTWYIRSTGTAASLSVVWGGVGDVPTAGDYDGDGKTDIAIFRPSTGTWYVRSTATGAGVSLLWGVASDVPVPADYDGDGKTDLAVFRRSTGTWFVRYMATSAGVSPRWGGGNDVPVPGDYDGDGVTDIAIFRPPTGTWFIRDSVTGAGTSFVWGGAGDIPVLGRP